MVDMTQFHQILPAGGISTWAHENHRACELHYLCHHRLALGHSRGNFLFSRSSRIAPFPELSAGRMAPRRCLFSEAAAR
jgi:hypothetical protein